MIYNATSKNKLLPAGAIIDISRWLNDGWIIARKPRFFPNQDILLAFYEVTGKTEFREAEDSNDFKLNLVLYHLMVTRSGLSTLDISKFLNVEEESVYFGSYIVNGLKSDDIIADEYMNRHYQEIVSKLESGFS